MEYYILEGHLPRPVTALVWMTRRDDANRTVAKTRMSPAVEVVTIFLGLNLQWRPEGKPLLFQTKVVGGRRDGEQWRYTTWEEAEAGHQAVVKTLRSMS
jgi:hypothetical protein